MMLSTVRIKKRKKIFKKYDYPQSIPSMFFFATDFTDFHRLYSQLLKKSV